MTKKFALSIALLNMLSACALAQTARLSDVRSSSWNTDNHSVYYEGENPPASPSDQPVTPPPVISPDEDDEDSLGGKDWFDGCDAKGGSGDCNCYLFGPSEPWALSSGENALGLKVGGWLSAGYSSHTEPLSQTYGDELAFLDVPHRVVLNQAWIYLERAASRDGGWDWGFRSDVLYGTDAHTTQAYGQTSGWDVDWDHGVYGWAWPQLYAELANENLSIKAGHFFTPEGYEVVNATGNFFYSHSLAHYNTEAFTHTGVLATVTVTEKLDAYGGWVAGWDTAFRSQDGGNMGIGGFSYKPFDAMKVVYVTTIGDLGLRGGQTYDHDIFVDMTLTERLNWVVQTDLLSVNETGELDRGLCNYLFYTINDCWKLGARAEWWDNDGVEHSALTAGINYRPHANLVLRPEMRWNRSQDDVYDVDLFAMDAVFSF